MALRRDNKVVAEEWERVKELFETALDCPAQQRAELLSRLQLDDPAVARQVSDLLTSHEQAGDFLHQPLIFSADFLDDLDEPQRFAPDDVLCNRFKIIRLIGKGGMGEVYEAFDQELEEHVALKTLRFEVSSNEIFTARFRREIQLARKVTHPNVCRIFESLRHQIGNETISVLTMELLQGQTLGDYLKSKGRLSPDEALPLAQQIIDGLSAVHAAGIIHRDLKPSNLVLVPEGDSFRVKITDFGIAGGLPANPSQPALTQASKILGTPDYMAPEQLEHGHASIQSDIYSLGLLLYEMATGTKPFAGDSAWKRLYSRAPNPAKIVPAIDDSWKHTILCCLDKDPAKRPRSADDVITLLKAPPRRRLVYAVAATILFLLMLLGIREFWPHSINPDAQLAVDLARRAIENPSKDGYNTAIAQYRRALGIEPKWAEAWAELAYAYASASNARYIDGQTSLTEAHQAALKAIEIDPHLAKAVAALAWTESFDFDEWPKAEEHFRSALRLDPENGPIHYWFGVHLRKKGRYKEAEEHDQLALRLTHENDPYIWYELGFLYWTSGQLAKFHDQMQEELKAFPNSPMTRFLNARLLKLEGQYAKAEEELMFSQQLGYNRVTVLVEQASLEEYKGDFAAARRDIALLEQASHSAEIDGVLLAGDYIGLHDTDAAFRVLESALEKKDNTMLSLATSPVLEPLHQDPRYLALLRRLHFTDQIMQQIGFN